MKQENVPLGKLEFQHSTITLLDPRTNQTQTLQINRVKPIEKEAREVTIYSLFVGKENPEHLQTIIFSDKQQKDDDGKRGEEFVVLKPGTFDFTGTTERFATAYSQKAAAILAELKKKHFQDERVSQAVWKVSDKDDMRKMKGILQGVPYTVRSKRGGDKIPGYHIGDDSFQWTEIANGAGNVIAKVTAEHFQGTVDGDSIIYKFSTFENGAEKVVMELKRYYRDKSEFQTLHGTGTTVGISSSGGLVVGWTDIDLQTPVNFQNENTMLFSYGPREAILSQDEIESNSKKVSAILILMGGASILDGFNFQDSEIEWEQSSQRLAKDSRERKQTVDQGFWLELPVDSTTRGRQEALTLLSSR